MFEKAARLKLRFNFKGILSVEDLWDLSLESLDLIYKNLSAEAKKSKEVSLLEIKTKEGVLLFVVVADGSGWEHVSVSPAHFHRCPTWAEMCFIKDLFWEPEETVVQFHPAKSEYVNLHQYCLHLWKPIDIALPTPTSILVGPKKRSHPEGRA